MTVVWQLKEKQTVPPTAIVRRGERPRWRLYREFETAAAANRAATILAELHPTKRYKVVCVVEQDENADINECS